MSIAIDLITRKKLNLAKQLYQHALLHASAQHNAIRQALAVIGFDLAVETTLGIVVTSLDPSATPKESFQLIMKQADDLLLNNSLGGVPDKHQIQKVRSIRNDAQHKMKYPSKTTVSDCRTYTHDFLQKIILNVWGLALEELRLAELVSHAKVRQHLIDAELALSTKQFEESIKNAATGLELAISLVRPAIVGFQPSFAKGFITGDSLDKKKFDTDTFKAFKKMQDLLMILSLSMSYTDFMNYKRIVGDVILISDELAYFPEAKSNIDSNDAEYVVNFCIDSVIKIEENIGELDKPFGQDRFRLAVK